MLKQLGKRKVAKVKKYKEESKNDFQFDRKVFKKIDKIGNTLRKGSILHGKNVREISNIKNKYLTRLIAVIRENWKLPTYLMGKKLSCKIRIFISKKGKVLKYEIYKSSKSKSYDNWAVKSIKMIKVLIPPPQEIQEGLRRGDLILGFPL